MEKDLINSFGEINKILQFKYGLRNKNDRIDWLSSQLLRLSKNVNATNDDVKDAVNYLSEKGEQSFDVDDKTADHLQHLIKHVYDFANSDDFTGEDIVGIADNQFVTNKGKSDNGQVFTPQHIAQLMVDVIGVDSDDVVLDACAGDGALLTESLTKTNHLVGVEIDSNVFPRLLTNLVIHDNSDYHLYRGDMLDSDFKPNFSNVTKIMLNPPYEKKYHPIEIITRLFDMVPNGTVAAVLLPDNKLEKEGKRKVRNLLTKNKLTKIIKLPKNVFNASVEVSLFVFVTGESTEDNDVFTCYIKDDGFETVKNQGRQDVHNHWPSIETKWLDIIKNEKLDDTCSLIKPNLKDMTGLSWPKPQKPFTITTEDFMRTVMNYELFKAGVDVKQLRETIADEVLYQSDITELGDKVLIAIPKKTVKPLVDAKNEKITL